MKPKTQPRMKGYRKMLVTGVGMVAVAIVAIFAPDQVVAVGGLISGLAGAYILGQAAEDSAAAKAGKLPE